MDWSAVYHILARATKDFTQASTCAKESRSSFFGIAMSWQEIRDHMAAQLSQDSANQSTAPHKEKKPVQILQFEAV